MTLESVKDLGDVELCVLIAEAIGWEYHAFKGGWKSPGADRPSRDSKPPVFTEDLNPLHQIEISRFKTIEQNHMYCEKLTTVCRGTDYHPFSAPARLRAEAILLTLGGGHE